MQNHEPGHKKDAMNYKTVTSLVQQKQAIVQDQAGQWHLPFEQMPFGIVVVDGGGGIQQANTIACTLLGYSLPDLQSCKIFDLVHPDDLEEDLLYLRALGNESLSISQREERYIRQDRSLFWTLVTKMPIFFADQDARCCLLILQDISMKKEYEEGLSKILQETRMRNSQLEAIFESINDNIIAFGADELPFRINSI